MEAYRICELFFSSLSLAKILSSKSNWIDMLLTQHL